LLWGERDPEARGIEEYAETSYGSLGEAITDVCQWIEHATVCQSQLYVAAAAWMMEFRVLELKGYDLAAVAGALWEFDLSAQLLEVDDDKFKHATAMIADLNLGILKPVLLTFIAEGNKKVLADLQHFDKPSGDCRSRPLKPKAR